MCDDKDVQRLTFDSYLYKRVVAMNPWQQIKLTLLTLGAVLRGQALAPVGYQPVRSEEEVSALLHHGEPPTPGPMASPDGAGKQGNAGTALEEREPALASR
jgi:geranylgeranyl reductase